VIDIDEHVLRAVAAPISEPPEMTKITSLAKRRRRRRTVLRTTAAVALVSVIGIAALAVASATGRDSRVQVVGPGPGGTRPVADLTVTDLKRQLTRAGERVSSDGTAPDSLVLTPTARLLCVNRTQVRVYEYGDRASRVAVSDTISPDGSTIGIFNPDGSTAGSVIFTWIGPAHFFAKGRIIVLVLQDDIELLQTLSDIMGPTISPQASRSLPATAPCEGSTTK